MKIPVNLSLDEDVVKEFKRRAEFRDASVSWIVELFMKEVNAIDHLDDPRPIASMMVFEKAVSNTVKEFKKLKKKK